MIYKYILYIYILFNITTYIMYIYIYILYIKYILYHHNIKSPTMFPTWYVWNVWMVHEKPDDLLIGFNDAYIPYDAFINTSITSTPDNRVQASSGCTQRYA